MRESIKFFLLFFDLNLQEIFTSEFHTSLFGPLVHNSSMGLNTVNREINKSKINTQQ